MDNLHEDYITEQGGMQADNSLVITSSNLPTNFDDLAQFVLVGNEQLKMVRTAIKSIVKLGLAQDVLEQKLREAQEIGEAVLDAKVRIGELMAQVPKATPNNNPFHENNSSDNFVKSKTDVIREAGFTPMQVSQFQRMAERPDIVEQAKAEAREKGDIVSQAQVLDKIKKPSNNPRGWTKEDREGRELTRQVLDYTHNAPIPEYTLDMLVNEIKLDADNYFSSLNFRLTSNAALISGENADTIGNLIDDYVICGIEEIRRKVS